jgi:leucyl/phenylalanyl-tRNA--protein transferase
MQLVLTPELVLETYREGLFPMAVNADSPFIHWVRPDERGQLSIPGLHIPRRLKDALRRHDFTITTDHAFDRVIAACAMPGPKRPETWINPAIVKVFCELHARGHAHSVECWRGDELVGGIYGLEIGGAFFGESMFSRATNASKIALVHLTARLWKAGFTLFDTQFVNDHLMQFGVYELPHTQYLLRLSQALSIPADFMGAGQDERAILEEYLRCRNVMDSTNRMPEAY